MTQTTRGALELTAEIGQVLRGLGAQRDVRLHRVGAAVEHHHLVPALQQALHHVAAHPAQADHGELHLAISSHICTPMAASSWRSPRASVNRMVRMPSARAGSRFRSRSSMNTESAGSACDIASATS